MRAVRGNQISMIFQEPMTSLNPVYTVGWQIMEAVRLHQKKSRRDARSARSSCSARGHPGARDERRRVPAPALRGACGSA
jgi:ABC-type microcin C transport system duplicated ATPase subunit YejF